MPRGVKRQGLLWTSRLIYSTYAIMPKCNFQFNSIAILSCYVCIIGIRGVGFNNIIVRRSFAPLFANNMFVFSITSRIIIQIVCCMYTASYLYRIYRKFTKQNNFHRNKNNCIYILKFIICFLLIRFCEMWEEYDGDNFWSTPKNTEKK